MGPGAGGTKLQMLCRRADNPHMTAYAQLSDEDVDAVQQVLHFLDLHADFRRDLVDTVISDDWPDRWLSVEEICEQLQRRDFWENHVRGQVGANSRPLLVEHYLRTMTQHVSTIGVGWRCYNNQFKYRRPEIPEEDPDERRRHDRLRCELISCQYGRVYDISASGLMVIAKRRHRLEVEDEVELQLECLDEDITVSAEVARINKVKRQTRIGMRFKDLTREDRVLLGKIIRVASMCQLV